MRVSVLGFGVFGMDGGGERRQRREWRAGERGEGEKMREEARERGKEGEGEGYCCLLFVLAETKNRSRGREGGKEGGREGSTYGLSCN